MSAATHPRVVVVGSFNVDHAWQCDSLPRPGETRAGSYRTGPGGKGFNQATASARCGVDTVFCARSATTTAAARAPARRTARPAPTAQTDRHRGITSMPTQQHRIGPGANGSSPAEFCRQAGAQRGVLAQLESPVESVRAMARAGRRAHDPNPAPANALPGELLAADVDAQRDRVRRPARAPQQRAHRPGTASPARTTNSCPPLPHALPRGTVVVTWARPGRSSRIAGQMPRHELPFYRVPAPGAVATPPVQATR